MAVHMPCSQGWHRFQRPFIGLPVCPHQGQALKTKIAICLSKNRISASSKRMSAMHQPLLAHSGHIAQVQGIQVGHHTDPRRPTGCSDWCCAPQGLWAAWMCAAQHRAPGRPICCTPAIWCKKCTASCWRAAAPGGWTAPLAPYMAGSTRRWPRRLAWAAFAGARRCAVRCDAWGYDGAPRRGSRLRRLQAASSDRPAGSGRRRCRRGGGQGIWLARA